MKAWLGLVVPLAAFALAPAALGAPPSNDNRDSAASIPTFPATIEGTTVEATVERLDPQISSCGRIEGTTWYRIDQAPDGTVALAVQGAGVAPVVRVYDLVKNGISEHTCANAPVGASAQVTFGTKRGATYLVVVGRKPSTADGAFELTARLFLPPLNDTRGEAAPLASKLSAGTLGATTDSNDPHTCGLVDGTVWYSVSPATAARLVLRLHAAGDLDAAVAVVRRVRNSFDTVACGASDSKGDAGLAWDVEHGASYLVVVGQRKGSPPGDFTLTVGPAPPGDTAPGKPLPSTGAGAVLNWLTNVNDVYSTKLTAGRTYRIAFRSSGCATLVLRSKRRELDRFPCSGYRTFTPGPDGGGRYILEVLAPSRSTAARYHLQIAPAGADDTGVGIELANLTIVRGSLAPSGIDIVDLYHFDVSAAPASTRALRRGRPRRDRRPVGPVLARARRAPADTYGVVGFRERGRTRRSSDVHAHNHSAA